MSNDNKLHVAIDLGGDTLKLAFGYDSKVDGNLRFKYGKFSSEDSFMQIGIPAVAFLSKKTGKWLFGSQVDSSGEDDFTTVVHIKNLISLLAERRDKEVQRSNTEYYNKKRVFPKYYLPSEHKNFKDLSQAEKEGRTFTSPHTPRRVCENFFMYVRALVNKGIQKLEREKKILFSEIEYSIVYPTKVGEKFIAEYERLVCIAFDIPSVNKSLSSVKSLGVYAYHSGMVPNNTPFLVFDIGEEYISVAKLWVKDGTPYIDGTDGHKKQERLGGIDIDESIRDFIESDLMNRETIATPSVGTLGHVNESCIDAQKYRFLQDIKCAKHILSTPCAEGEKSVRDGVSLVMCRECYVRTELKKCDFQNAIGVGEDAGNGDSIAARITNYIIEETTDIINSDVDMIFIAGGVIETCGLVDYISRMLNKVSDHTISVNTFDDTNKGQFSDDFTIQENESSVYAAVIGAAIVATEDINIKTVISLTYGTWCTSNSDKLFEIIAEKGEALNETGVTVFESRKPYHETIYPDKFSNYTLVKDDTIYSSVITTADIKQRKYANKPNAPEYRGSYLSINNDYEIGAAEKWYKLKTLVSSDVALYYNGKPVSVKSLSGVFRIGYKEYITCNAEGRATLQVKISSIERADKMNTPAYVVIKGYKDPVKVTDLEMRWVNEPEINMETNDD